MRRCHNTTRGAYFKPGGRRERPAVKIVSCAIALLGLVVFLTFATYPVDTAVATLLKRIRARIRR